MNLDAAFSKTQDQFPQIVGLLPSRSMEWHGTVSPSRTKASIASRCGRFGSLPDALPSKVRSTATPFELALFIPVSFCVAD